MAQRSKAEILHLSERLNVEVSFLTECVEASVVEIEAVDGVVDLGHGTVLHLRRLQRICHTFEIDFHVALLLYKGRELGGGH
jgi:hypothetical protein